MTTIDIQRDIQRTGLVGRLNVANVEAVRELLAEAARGYVEALMWTESCRGDAAEVAGHECFGEDCDTSLGDLYEPVAIGADAQEEIVESVWRFIVGSPDDVRDWVETQVDSDWTGAEDLGHNLLLSRNGGGSGFWDRGRGALGDRLHAAANALGEMSLYVGDDGALYV
jgi:hypothetical protein